MKKNNKKMTKKTKSIKMNTIKNRFVFYYFNKKYVKILRN